ICAYLVSASASDLGAYATGCQQPSCFVKSLHLAQTLNKALQSFPGPPVHWLFGNVHEFSRRGKDLDKLLEWSKKYARAFPVWFGKFVVFVSLNDADYAKAVCARGGKRVEVKGLEGISQEEFSSVPSWVQGGFCMWVVAAFTKPRSEKRCNLGSLIQAWSGQY
uniref:Uncharacterized protein n=1 Tax=Gopherus agassizii TaxID=38772 RepID=A0A452HKQ5_9SAUR